MEVQYLPVAVFGKPCVGRLMLRLFATPFRVLLTRCLDHSSSRITESLKLSKDRDDRSSLGSTKKRVPAQTATPLANRPRRQKFSRPVGKGYDPGSRNPALSEKGKPISHTVTTVKLETGLELDVSPRSLNFRRRAISWLIPHFRMPYIEDASLKEVILHILARWHHNDQSSDSESTGERRSITCGRLGLNHQLLPTFCI